MQHFQSELNQKRKIMYGTDNEKAVILNRNKMEFTSVAAKTYHNRWEDTE